MFPTLSALGTQEPPTDHIECHEFLPAWRVYDYALFFTFSTRVCFRKLLKKNFLATKNLHKTSWTRRTYHQQLPPTTLTPTKCRRTPWCSQAPLLKALGALPLGGGRLTLDKTNPHHAPAVAVASLQAVNLEGKLC